MGIFDFKTALNQISSILLEPTTVFKEGFGVAGRKVQARREKIRLGDRKEAVSVIAETLTATALVGAGILAIGSPLVAGRLIVKALPTTLKGQLGLVTGTGILLSSKVVRKKAGQFIQDPTKVGREAGELIDKVVAGEDTGDIGDVFKTAGLVGAGVGIVGAGILLGKKLKDRKKDIKVVDPSDVPSSNALPISPIPDANSPLSTDPVVALPPETRSPTEINVRVVNRPQINIAVAQ